MTRVNEFIEDLINLNEKHAELENQINSTSKFAKAGSLLGTVGTGLGSASLMTGGRRRKSKKRRSTKKKRRSTKKRIFTKIR